MYLTYIMVFFTFVRTSSTGIVETFGKQTSIANPGLKLYIPIIQRVIHVNNRLLQDQFQFEGKTKDNVFVNLNVAVQYKIEKENSVKAYYSLDDAKAQIDSYIENKIRETTPKLTLDELFESQDDICKSVESTVAKKMFNYGYTIENTLITAIDPDNEVKDAMNKINASHRLKIAAENEAQADYIRKVKDAEARAKAKELQGIGLGKQRLAILNSYKEGMLGLTEATGLPKDEIAKFTMETLHYDSLVDIANKSNTKTIFLNQDPHRSNNISSSIRDGVLQAK